MPAIDWSAPWIPTVLWSALWVGVLLVLFAVITPRPVPALIAAVTGIALITAFSWAAALSIGVFTIALVAVGAALVATRGLPIWSRVLAGALGSLVYWLAVWEVEPFLGSAGWGLPLVAIAAVVGRVALPWLARRPSSA